MGRRAWKTIRNLSVLGGHAMHDGRFFFFFLKLFPLGFIWAGTFGEILGRSSWDGNLMVHVQAFPFRQYPTLQYIYLDSDYKDIHRRGEAGFTSGNNLVTKGEWFFWFLYSQSHSSHSINLTKSYMIPYENDSAMALSYIRPIYFLGSALPRPVLPAAYTNQSPLQACPVPGFPTYSYSPRVPKLASPV